MGNERDCITVYPEEDTSRFLRNPAMGWALYIDAFEVPFPDAQNYWNRQDPNIELASILYIRVPWAELEPEEGRFAWKYDENYRQLIQMALDRGLKLAFRVYVDSKNAYRQATPQFVFDSGAEGYANEPLYPEHLTPFLYDRVFQRKLEQFVQAFADEYDNPRIVDFIDAQGLGWWGEMHSVEYMEHLQKKEIFEWIVNVYSRSFRRVLLGLQYGNNSFDAAWQDWALREKGYMIRRDSFGSPIWLSGEDKEHILRQWPAVPVFAENCYHTFASRPEWYQGDGFATLRDVMLRVVEDAKELHANTLDLRNPEDAGQWMQVAPDIVRDFAIQGGYRFVLRELTYPASVREGETLTLTHSWVNTGVGKLPNNLSNWNYKYKLSFALLDRHSGKPVYQMFDEAELSTWLKGSEYRYTSVMAPSGTAKGNYDLAAAIVDTHDGGTPAIKLAIRNAVTEELWYIIGSVTVK